MGDWERHVEHYAPLLRRLIAAFIAWFGNEEDGIAATLSRRAVRLILRVLVPAESAVRRLIVLAAHAGLAAWKGSGPWEERRRRKEAGVASLVPMSEELEEKGGDDAGTYAMAPNMKVPAFALFDPLMRFAPWQEFPEAGIVRFDDNDIRRQFEHIPVARLYARLLSIRNALDNIPAEAARLLRWWKKRRKATCRPSRVWPLKGGYPPGWQLRGKKKKQEQDEVDKILDDCARLANTLHRQLDPP